MGRRARDMVVPADFATYGVYEWKVVDKQVVEIKHRYAQELAPVRITLGETVKMKNLMITKNYSELSALFLEEGGWFQSRIVPASPRGPRVCAGEARKLQGKYRPAQRVLYSSAAAIPIAARALRELGDIKQL